MKIIASPLISNKKILSNNCIVKRTPFFDTFSFGNTNYNINRCILIGKNIISEDEDVDEFFDNISLSIFKNSPYNKNEFLNLLKEGYIGFSSSILYDIKNPQSAVARVINEKSDGQTLTSLTSDITQGKGVGINFTLHQDPIDKIRKINSYFKYKANSVKRPPAGIALLNYNHPKIIDFITLKNNEDYKDWCFDLSVILPYDFIYKVDKKENIVLKNGEKISSVLLYNTLLNSMLKKGEPGIIFSENENYICDPCSARELKESEGLTISHINLLKFFDKKNNKIDFNKLRQATALLSCAISKIDSDGCIGVVGYQELLNKAGLKYGDKKSLEILAQCLRSIQEEAHKNNVKTAISPTSTVSAYLNVTSNIQPADYENVNYISQLDTIITAQKYIDYNISNTIILNKDDDINTVDKIIRYAVLHKLKGITVFKP